MTAAGRTHRLLPGLAEAAVLSPDKSLRAGPPPKLSL